MDRKLLIDEIQKHGHLVVPIFEGYVIPNGHLDTHRESHALFFYYLNARMVYDTKIKNRPIILEGEPDEEYNLLQLIKSVAALYGVQIEEMVKAWDLVDKQCLAVGLIPLPDEYQYRFVGRKGLQ